MPASPTLHVEPELELLYSCESEEAYMYVPVDDMDTP